MKKNSKYRIAIVISKFNNKISNYLYEGAVSEFKQNGRKINQITTHSVPGAFEIPGTVMQLVKHDDKIDGILTLGSVIKGETAHFDYISSSVTQSLSHISIYSNIPIIFGILTTYTYEEAFERAHPLKKNKGGEVMSTLLKTMETYNKIKNK